MLEALSTGPCGTTAQVVRRGHHNRCKYITWLLQHCTTLLCQITSFASEWIYILKRAGTIDPGFTDRVFLLTSGTFAQISHIFCRDSSSRYRFALIAWVVCIALSVAGPSSFSVQITLLPRQQLNFHVGNISNLTHISTIYDTIAAITYIEQNLNNSYIVQVPSGTLIPWPS